MSAPERNLSAIKEKVRRLPHRPGVYLMKDRLGSVLYVGKAKDLKKRVSTYFQPSRNLKLTQPKVAAMIDLIHDVDTLEVRSEQEALLLEGKLIKQFRPKYNTDFTDNKQFLLVRVDTASPLPRFRLCRNRLEDGARYFGPFAHSGALRRTLAHMRKEYGILLSDARPQQLEDGRWELYADARREIYGQSAPVTQEEYQQRVQAACSFLEGHTRTMLADLRKQMAEAAEERQYERAARLRDAIAAMEATAETTKGRTFARIAPALPSATDPDKAMKELQAALSMRVLPKVMECFDISHLGGEYVVASMVQFQNGRPEPRQYRRFKIKSFSGNDDFRAMEEVVGRRYRRLHAEERPLPDLIVIDGGAGQVGAALQALFPIGLEAMPALIGLAKREETIIFPDSRQPLNLPHHSPALRLIQHLRDEAHRFANTFNAELRSRRIRESILDEFDGMGPVRRAALLKHFGSLEKLRNASVEDICQVDGIGPKFAESLHSFLHP